MKHTPGPWFVFGNGHCVGGPLEGDPAETGQTSAGVAMCAMRLRTDEESAANAQLIAAAPELLEALEELLSDAEGHYGLTGARERARQAIEKARGGA